MKDSKQGLQMGVTHAELTLRSVGNRKSVKVRALVDTGTSGLIVTPDVAKALGFDIEECVAKNVILADGSIVRAPRLEGIMIEYGDRDCGQVATVLSGSECLLGFVPLEDMDLIVDPREQRLVPRHADGQHVRFPIGRV